MTYRSAAAPAAAAAAAAGAHTAAAGAHAAAAGAHAAAAVGVYMQVLDLTHPVHLLRDTSKYKPLRPPFLRPTAAPSLRLLVKHHFNRNIQTGSHDPTEDARETMNLYVMVKQQWNKRFAAAAAAAAGDGTEAADGDTAAAAAAADVDDLEQQQLLQQQQQEKQQQQQLLQQQQKGKRKRKRREPHEYFLE